jgi:hypothetical protein
VAAGRLPIRPSFLRAARDGAIVACLVLVVAHLLGAVQLGVDAYTYWTVDPTHPYGAVRPGEQGAFFYAPPFAQLIAPFHVLPWTWFAALWTLLLTGALVWQAGLWTGFVLFLVPVFSELGVGNIHLLLGAVCVLGFRWPALWSFALLTKVTPGIGLLWFAVRREWRSLALALGTTAAISAVSFVVAPGLWREWIDTLRAATSAEVWPFTIQVPLPIRLAAAAAIVSWGALTDRRWTVPLAATLALPVLWVNGLSMLVAMIPFIPALGTSPAAAWFARSVRAGVGGRDATDPGALAGEPAR